MNAVKHFSMSNDVVFLVSVIIMESIVGDLGKRLIHLRQYCFNRQEKYLVCRWRLIFFWDISRPDDYLCRPIPIRSAAAAFLVPGVKFDHFESRISPFPLMPVAPCCTSSMIFSFSRIS